MRRLIFGFVVSVFSSLSLAGGLLKSGEALNYGQQLVSPNGVYTLVMQTDGNLVLYKDGVTAKWATYTQNKNGYKTVMYKNLLVQDGGGANVWSTNISMNAFYDDVNYLNVQDDGNVVVYGHTPIWANRMWRDGDNPPDAWRYIASGYSMSPGFQVVNGRYRLVFQYDGNLVVYRDDNVAVWNSQTQGKGGVRLVMQADGNLVMYTSANKAIWYSGTSGKPGSYLGFDSLGRIVILQPVPKWGVFGVPAARPIKAIDPNSGLSFSFPIYSWAF